MNTISVSCFIHEWDLNRFMYCIINEFIDLFDVQSINHFLSNGGVLEVIV
eukprot:m.80129 g.80129  ORF g.80129 m.80129 type:complete len:50 (-) comp12003_c1_seq5:1028-1177(-)